jgi:hypothetical protein
VVVVGGVTGVVLEEVEAGPEVASYMRSTAGCILRRRQLLGALGIAAVNREASRGERRRSKKGFASTKLSRAGIRPIAQRTWRRRRMAGAWRWRGSVATRGEHGDEATRALG